MKPKSKELRRAGLDALRGNWKTAILTYFVASLFGATVTSGAGFSANFNVETSLEEFIGTIPPNMATVFAVVTTVFSILSIVSLIIGGAMRMGYAKYNLNLVDRKEAKFNNLFSMMNYKWKGFCMNFFMGLYTFLWSLLFAIPGLIKSYAYSMTPYIKAENPEMTANQAIGESISLMMGNKWRLFKLHLSFIGWGILAALPPTIVGMTALLSEAPPEKLFTAVLVMIPLCAGYLFLTPYIEAANAAFYRTIVPAKEEEPENEWYLSE